MICSCRNKIVVAVREGGIRWVALLIGRGFPLLASVGMCWWCRVLSFWHAGDARGLRKASPDEDSLWTKTAPCNCRARGNQPIGLGPSPYVSHLYCCPSKTEEDKTRS